MDRPRLMRDWVGLTVTNRVELRTRHVIFPPGTQFTVEGVWRGLKLDTVRQCPAGCPECYVLHRHGVDCVRPEKLDIVQD